MQNTLNSLSTLKLNGIKNFLEEQLEEAERSKASYLSFIDSLLKKELEYRTERRLRRNLASAHFPVLKKLNDFRFSGVKGISKTDIANVMDFRWLDNHENILFFGPPGLGKTHLSIAIGAEALNKGYTVAFERITNLIQVLKTSEIQRSSTFRVNRIKKVDLVIIDEIGYTPIERREANLFFNLISELYEKSSIIITSNKDVNAWAEMMGDEIMTVAMLDRLLHHARIFNLDGKSYRLRGKEV
jgi:DNA replication protein DnaC